MKIRGCRTIHILACGLLFLGTLPAWGQGENPPASTTESGATSGHGMTLVEQNYKGAVEDQIEALHGDRWQAALHDDSGFFERQLADQYFGVGADGRLRTKAETVESFKSGVIKYEAIDERDVKVNTYGGDAAIVNSTASIKATIQGKPVNGNYRATFVYVKEGGNWREVAFQLAPVAKEG
ncbi:MAG: nuclear transport factor 2 family protein [Terriglobales bacterium]